MLLHTAELEFKLKKMSAEILDEKEERCVGSGAWLWWWFASGSETHEYTDTRDTTVWLAQVEGLCNASGRTYERIGSIACT